VIANTAGGKLQGLEKRGVAQFRGIRYATAARFGPPQPVEPWTDVLDATHFGAIAPQNDSPLENMLGAQDVPSGEDCLFLNVFTPALDGERPVMVWIHGGGFTAGSGSVPWYDGTRLAARGDVVVVTLNYRLGALGFLAVDGFPGSGSAGIADQIAALEWVRDNIAGFGGDPAKVTIFGESAGGMSVGALLAAPGARGLFRGAIAQSGAGEHVHTFDSSARVAAAFLEEIGSTDPSALLDASVEELLAAQQRVGERARLTASGLLPFMPSVDGVVLDRLPNEAVRAGAAVGVRLVTGTTSDEWNLFHVMERASGSLDEAKLQKRVAAAVGERAADLIEVYRHNRPDADVDYIWCAIATDWVFRMPAVRLLAAQSAHQADTWSYEVAIGAGLGACHAIDVPFVFDNVRKAGVDLLVGTIDDDVLALSAQISGAWSAFATALEPSAEGLPAWRRYSADDRAVLTLDRKSELIVDPRLSEREAWAEIAG
jgi:para-nitrobenzyl esterase